MWAEDFLVAMADFLTFSAKISYRVRMLAGHKKVLPSTMPAAWLVNYLLRRGINPKDIAPLLSSPLGVASDSVSHSQPIDMSSVLELENYLQLMEWASQTLQDPLLGVHIAEEINTGEYGILGHLVSNCASLRSRFDFLDKYHKLFSSDFAFHLSGSDDCAWCVYTEASHSEGESRQDVLLSLTMVLRGLREYADSDWRPLRCCFTFSAPKDIRPLTERFGDNLSFDYPVNKIAFEHELLDRSSKRADPTLLSILLQQADQLLDQMGENDDLVEKVRLLIVTSLGENSMSAEIAADHLNMSVRSLNRHLGSQNTSYRKVRREVIMRVAKEALAETEVSIFELSGQLGFSETSAFDRAFKNMEKVSPKKYRQAHRQ